MRGDSNERSLLESGGVAALVGGLHVMIGAALLAAHFVPVAKIREPLHIHFIERKPRTEPIPPPTAARATLTATRPVSAEIPHIAVESDPPVDIERTDGDPRQPPAQRGDPVLAPARVLRSSPPDYPDYEAMQNHAGTVELKILIGTDGHARDVQLMKTSGHPNLDKAAISAVRRWLFEAARRDGVTIETWAALKVRFDLR